MELLIHLDGFSGPLKDGWRALTELAAASSFVITEEMPVSPYAQWSKVLRLLTELHCLLSQYLTPVNLIKADDSVLAGEGSPLTLCN